MIQIGMHAGRAGGADRYFDGLCHAFNAMGVAYRGFVFEGKAEKLDSPRGLRVLGPSKGPLRERIALLRSAVTRAGSGEQRSEVGGRRSEEGERAVVASHFALYSWPVIHPMAQRRREVAAVSHFHGPWADESAMEGASKLAVAGKRMLERWVYRSSARVISDSEAFRRVAIESYGVRPDRVFAVPAAMDAQPFAAAAAMPRETAREQVGWSKGRKIVFCLRRLTRRMGLDRLIEAWGAVVQAHPEALLVIGGTGPLREELERQVRARGLESHVSFAGFVAEKDLPVAYRAADFSVVPSLAMEGFGLVILESLAVGTPVMVTPIGGMPEIMRPLQQELVLRDSSVSELERGLIDLLSGSLPVPPEQKCVEYVLKNYNWRLAAERVMEVYAAAEKGR